MMVAGGDGQVICAPWILSDPAGQQAEPSRVDWADTGAMLARGANDANTMTNVSILRMKFVNAVLLPGAVIVGGWVHFRTRGEWSRSTVLPT